jgi:hypothetical protein
MQKPNHEPHRGKRYYYVLVPVLLAIIAAGIIFIDQAPWLLVISGALLGGVIVDAIVDWGKHRGSGDSRSGSAR